MIVSRYVMHFTLTNPLPQTSNCFEDMLFPFAQCSSYGQWRIVTECRRFVVHISQSFCTNSREGCRVLLPCSNSFDDWPTSIKKGVLRTGFMRIMSQLKRSCHKGVMKSSYRSASQGVWLPTNLLSNYSRNESTRAFFRWYPNVQEMSKTKNMKAVSYDSFDTIVLKPYMHLRRILWATPEGECGNPWQFPLYSLYVYYNNPQTIHHYLSSFSRKYIWRAL